ncbi:Crp/Fnr family transcriptional regulator [Seonamhaeicola algicola]|uniref:Crp/Fnr family transcriptional regulator n=1 Tax=Seonamhaeicola algicola TaxID=1719036 RepID=UPI001FE61869|nr:Crp/Fnr family transcriptional regulator [Seonamhaeicola algicola]
MNKIKAQPLLNYIENFISLTDEEVDILLQNISFRNYLKGQYIAQQGDVCKSSYFVVKGCTKMFYLDDIGQEHIIMFSIENWWTGDLGSYIAQLPSDYHVQCLEPTQVITFSYEDREVLFEKIPKLERFFRLIIERALVSTNKRLVRNFSLTAKARYIYFKEQYPEIEKRIPQYMIASYLGITKEFLSKIKRQLLND